MLIFPNNAPTKLGHMNVLFVKAYNSLGHKSMQHALFIKDVWHSIKCSSGTLENKIGISAPTGSSKQARLRAQIRKSKFSLYIKSNFFISTKLGNALLRNGDFSGTLCTISCIYKGLIKLENSNAKYNHSFLVKLMRKLRLNYPKEIPRDVVNPIKQLSFEEKHTNKSYDVDQILCSQSRKINSLKQQLKWIRPRVAKLSTALTGIKATNKAINRQLKQIREGEK